MSQEASAKGVGLSGLGSVTSVLDTVGVTLSAHIVVGRTQKANRGFGRIAYQATGSGRASLTNSINQIKAISTYVAVVSRVFQCVLTIGVNNQVGGKFRAGQSVGT